MYNVAAAEEEEGQCWIEDDLLCRNKSVQDTSWKNYMHIKPESRRTVD